MDAGRTRIDPRWFQIATLAGLLGYGIAAFDFEIHPSVAAAIVAVALSVQALADRLSGRRIELRSALISTLSLCLLLRTASVPIAALAAASAIGSKYALRIAGKHVFNPTAFGIAVVLATTDGAWVSAGQWGTAPLAGLAFAGFGSLVIHRARASDITWAFVATYAGLLLLRSSWLGDPLPIPFHQLSSGAWLIFAFFMVSDPRTAPDARRGRVLYAIIVAVTALVLRFAFYQTNALLWSLVSCAPLVPWIDRLWPADRYEWSRVDRRSPNRTDRGETRDASTDDLGAVLPGLGTVG